MSRLRIVRLLITCAILFLVLQRIYIRVRNHHEAFLNDRLNGAPSAWVINTLTPHQDVVATGGEVIRRGTSGMDIKKGCEGFEVAILLVSVMAVYPLRWRWKVAGIMLGALFIYALNIVRIVSLYYLWIYRPQVFQLFHATVWQAIIILLAWLFFLLWVDLAGKAAPAAVSSPGKQRKTPGES